MITPFLWFDGRPEEKSARVMKTMLQTKMDVGALQRAYGATS
jgi:hypothetical protein